MATGAGNVVGFRFDGEMAANDYTGTLIPRLRRRRGATRFSGYSFIS
ncbi:hypothetical protein [Methanoculleus chikugoensis]|nr:hypothetical protein [Methanoculleus chikugoensis]